MRRTPAGMPSPRHWLKTATKYVFSHSLTASDWANTRFVKSDLEAAVTSMKGEGGADIVLIGSAGLAKDFVRGLVDEFRLTVNPVLLGAGCRFPAGEGARTSGSPMPERSPAAWWRCAISR